MLNRRRIVQSGLATIGSLSITAPSVLHAQGKQTIKIRYSEVVRSIMFAPVYAAITKGFFKDSGIDVALTTAQGGDKSVAALLSGSADIALIGPETAIYVQNSESPTKIPIFSGLCATDGFMLASREKIEKFEWSMLKGKDVLGFRQGSTPILFLETAMRQNGVNPSEVRLNNNIGIPARVGSWLAGQNQFAIFEEPEATQLEMDGKAHMILSIGKIVGVADYTTFMATDKYIKANPAIIQAWTNTIYRALKWSEEKPPEQVAEAVSPFFPGITKPIMTSAIRRYRDFKLWRKSPKIDAQGINKLQDILVEGKLLVDNKRVKFETLVNSEFANKAS